jgi:hypothetical protein
MELRRLCERLVKSTDTGDPQATGDGAFHSSSHSSGEPPAGGNGKDLGTG